MLQFGDAPTSSKYLLLSTRTPHYSKNCVAEFIYRFLYKQLDNEDNDRKLYNNILCEDLRIAWLFIQLELCKENRDLWNIALNYHIQYLYLNDMGNSGDMMAPTNLLKIA